MKIVGGVIAAVVLVALLKGVGGGDGSSSASHDGGANIYLVASKSFCEPTGIDDAYTGDGHVTFYLTFRNSGSHGGTVSAVPVRHYDDGDINESALDEVSVDVAAGDSWQGHTEAMTYKAHEHEVTDCGVRVDGRPEVSIPAQ
jgi:hypothetical protein